MSDSKIYIFELGYRDAFSDKDQIIWFLEQRAKTYSKKYATRYWLNNLETYENRLLNIQAYELLGMMKGKVTTEQRERREKIKLENQAKSQLLLAQCEESSDQWKNRKSLTDKLNYN